MSIRENETQKTAGKRGRYVVVLERYPCSELVLVGPTVSTCQISLERDATV